METWIQKKVVYKGDIFAVEAGDVSLDDGGVYRRQVVVNPGGVAVVPVLGDSVMFVRQFRIAVGQFVLEIPAGRLEVSEKPEECARRELAEETGYRAGEMVLLAQYYSAVGFATEEMHIFLARDLREGKRKPDKDERVNIERIAITEVQRMLSQREFLDSKTIIGLREALFQMGRGY